MQLRSLRANRGGYKKLTTIQFNFGNGGVMLVINFLIKRSADKDGIHVLTEKGHLFKITISSKTV